MRHDDGPPEHEDQLAFLEDALLDELVISSHHILAVKLQVLSDMKSPLFKGVELLKLQLYLFIMGDFILDSHPQRE